LGGGGGGILVGVVGTKHGEKRRPTKSPEKEKTNMTI